MENSDSARLNPTPAIPDHEMIRVIGRGAYGEIWLARGLTGAWRAVKVIWRANFESERIFQREFGGMAAFEPVSREHRGFVQVLHVGRDAGNAFFYYIMQLADDAAAGRAVNPENYRPHTLAGELSEKGRLPAAECVRLGLSLAETLAELHRRGLTHRDLKPANIIYVDGEPKLADIGLVAAHGQRSFVGTEGYVPPEGPGSAQADLYGLGKVLYELAMGRDRLDFPALPEALDRWADKEILLRLNAVLLKACANEPSRRFPDAAAMARALAEIGVEKKRRSNRRAAGWAAALLALAIAAGGALWMKSQPEPTTTPGALSVTTNPPGAMVVLGDNLRTTPARFESIEPGKYQLHIMRDGFEAVDRAVQIGEGRTLALPEVRLVRSRGALNVQSQPEHAALSVEGPLAPLPGEAASHHEGTAPLSLTALPTGEYRIVARLAASTVQQTIKVTTGEPTEAVLRFLNGSLKITSSPLGATVLCAGVEIGQTPLLIEDLPPDEVEYQLRLKGRREATVRARVEAGAQTFVAERLERLRIIEPGRPLKNSLGLRFVPLGKIRFCATETRAQDYAAFCLATAATWKRPDFATEPDHPVVNVNWSDANAFCRWLTERERAAGQLDEDLEYRLPTDAEWSQAVQLPDEGGTTPEQRDGRNKEQFPWGKAWPPPAGAGNYASTASKDPDGFSQTAPVGHSMPNALGLYDLGGNVWEWVADSYNSSQREWGVLRGGSWANRTRAELLSSYRNAVDRSERDVIFGFRCVLAPVTAAER